ncbi:uncharacterized protein [Dendrobates tinctorius]|uniref:uncharacterized protein n=1 Tax=Dendrobates tinctorius TaxID=92724 RepID=UPI003CC9D7E7
MNFASQVVEPCQIKKISSMYHVQKMNADLTRRGPSPTVPGTRWKMKCPPQEVINAEWQTVLCDAGSYSPRHQLWYLQAQRTDASETSRPTSCFLTIVLSLKTGRDPKQDKRRNSSREMDPDQLKENVLKFSLDDGPRGNQGYSRVVLQLFGYLGHGMSSFINSCKYALEEREEFIQYAKAGGYADVITLERTAYDLTRNITIVDNRGCPHMSSFHRAEIYTQLGNFLPIGEKVEWTKNYTDMMTRLEDAERNPNYSDFIVPIFISRATCCLSVCEIETLKELLSNCVKMTGVFPIIVITHKTSGDFKEIEKKFRLMGAEVVISIENYTEEDHIKTRGKTKDILMVIHSALEDVRYRLRQERNPQKDWRERKKFLLEYIQKADLKLKKKGEERNEGCSKTHFGPF